MIYVTDIRPDKAFANMLQGKIFENDFSDDSTSLTDEQIASLTDAELTALSPVSIYAYGDKPLSGYGGAFIELKANGTITSKLSSLEGASGYMIISLYTSLYSGIVDSYKESHILRQIQDRLRLSPQIDGYYFELVASNVVYNSTNSLSGYHTKGLNIKWNLTNLTE